MVTVIYVLVNLAYFAVVSRSELLASVAVAVVSTTILFDAIYLDRRYSRETKF